MDSEDRVIVINVALVTLCILLIVLVPTYLQIVNGTDRMEKCVSQGMEYVHIPELDKYQCVKP